MMIDPSTGHAPEVVDVAIVGGGPAGLATAISLIQIDPSWSDRLVVLEKQVHPRHKLCAGGLSPLALEHLARMQLKLDIPHIAARQANFTFQGRTIELPGNPAVVVTRRQEFDHWLAGCAIDRGVRLRQDVRVEGLERSAGGITLATSSGQIHAQVLVGADGSRGIVRRWLGYRETPPHVARLLEVVTPASGREPEFDRSFARFEFSPTLDRLQGYYWDFPSLVENSPSMNRGVFDARIAAAKERAGLVDILEKETSQKGAVLDKIIPAGHPIHWFSPTNRISAERVLLVGDAAGAEPLFGEGIGIALAYSELAAQLIEKAFRRQRFSFRAYRRRLLLSPLGHYLLLRWTAASLLYRFSEHKSFMALTWILGAGLRRMYGTLPSVPGVLPGR